MRNPMCLLALDGKKNSVQVSFFIILAFIIIIIAINKLYLPLPQSTKVHTANQKRKGK